MIDDPIFDECDECGHLRYHHRGACSFRVMFTPIVCTCKEFKEKA